MTEHERPQSSSFGGPWTKEKLDILERSLDAYTTSLKEQPFKLMYIDAFAGAGKILLRDKGTEEISFLSGSAERAAQVSDKQFDRLIFIEKDSGRCADLERLSKEHPGRDVRIENAEANDFMRNFQEDWRAWRGVLFLDPFATEVEWSTIEAIARFNALDTWILCPVSALARMLPRSRKPDDISEEMSNRLTRIFGDNRWKEVYHESRQQNLFGKSEQVRDWGVDKIVEVYKGNLSRLFGERFLPQSRTLKNSKNSPMYEFLCCVGHPRGIGPATRIAKHIIERI